MAQALREVLSEELNRPVAVTVQAIADVLQARYERAAVAVLFYGSCLRSPEAELADNLLDFYVLVDDYAQAYDKAWLAVANRVLPPNAFYCETVWQGTHIRAKYVVISLDDFARFCRPETQNVSVWARYAQPARIVWTRDAATVDDVVTACVDAVKTMLRRAWPLEPASRDARTLWIRALRETYASELRPEGADRAVKIFEADQARYERLTPLVLAELGQPEMSPEESAASWKRRRRLGKTLNLLRIVKGIFTFDGGLDYALWKIKRHSGKTVPVTDWQRRHPLLAAPGLAWRLYRMGAFR
jgi:hypothetical protein